MTYLDSEEEQKRLNELTNGKVVKHITYDGLGGDLKILFTDESEVVISTLGGLEVVK